VAGVLPAQLYLRAWFSFNIYLLAWGFIIVVGSISARRSLPSNHSDAASGRNRMCLLVCRVFPETLLTMIFVPLSLQSTFCSNWARENAGNKEFLLFSWIFFSISLSGW
jgi:hypothetical protein